MPGVSNRRRITSRFWQTLPLVLSLAAAVGLWGAVNRWGSLPDFILPSPAMVLDRFFAAVRDGSLLRNSLATLLEVFAGLAVGSLMATLMGYALAKSKTAEQVLSPFLVASQAVPVVAIAPLLVIWFGSGIFSKILICSLVVFFPILVNTVVGVRSVPDNLRDLMRSLNATRLQTIRYLELPAALPVLLGGLRIGATLSVIGAVVGEFAGADRGLGFLVNVGRGQYDTAMVFVAVLMLILMAVILYGIVALVEKRVLRWKMDSFDRYL